MENVRFVDVVVEEFRLPIGVPDKEHLNGAILNLTAMTEHIEGLSTRIDLEKLGMTEEEMKAQTDPVGRFIHTGLCQYSRVLPYD
jgi:hypothetical protein